MPLKLTYCFELKAVYKQPALGGNVCPHRSGVWLHFFLSVQCAFASGTSLLAIIGIHLVIYSLECSLT